MELQNAECNVVEQQQNVFDIAKYFEKLNQNMLAFSLSLHSHNNFTRKDVYEVQNSVDDLIVKPLLTVFEHFCNNKLNEDSVLYNEFTDIISRSKNLFVNCKSDYILTRKLKSDGYIDDIKEYEIIKENKNVYSRGELVFGEESVKCSILPIRAQIRVLFEQKNLLSDVLSHMQTLKLDNDNYQNYIQGPIWKKKCEFYPDRILIPYFLYADDLEINNSLGSHSQTHSVCNFYYSFPCFPKIEGKLDNIFLAAVIKTQDMKKYGNEKCLKPLIEELKLLEQEGLEFIFPDGKKQNVYFLLGLVLGDNLGLNSLLNFSKSFSSNFFCRFCKASKKRVTFDVY